MIASASPASISDSESYVAKSAIPGSGRVDRRYTTSCLTVMGSTVCTTKVRGVSVVSLEERDGLLGDKGLSWAGVGSVTRDRTEMSITTSEAAPVLCK